VIRWAMCNLGFEEWLALAVMSMYTGAKTVVRTVSGNSNSHRVCKPAYLVPVPSHDKLGGLCQEGHLA